VLNKKDATIVAAPLQFARPMLCQRPASVRPYKFSQNLKKKKRAAMAVANFIN
jgi:hypothetical protein